MTGDIPRAPVTRRHAVGWGLVALGLVTVVAMEANGAAWSKHRGTGVHSLPHGVIVAGAVGAGLLAVALFVLALLGTAVTETPDQRRRRWTAAIAFLVLVVLISVVGLLVHPSHRPAAPDVPAAAGSDRPAATSGKATHAGETWWPLVIVGLGTAVALVTVSTRRPRARATTDADRADAAVAVLDASLDDLRREPDPRRAVIASYARMERGLAACGFARRPSETPTEYLQRALAGDEDAMSRPGLEPLGELTALAERARFSTLAVDEAMRSRAIAAVEAMRRELRRESCAHLGPVV